MFMSLYAQNDTDSIQKVKVSMGYRYEQSGHILTMREIEYIMKDNHEATLYLKNAKTLNAFYNIISFAGGAMIGYPIGYGSSTGYYNWTVFAIGCGLVIISIPISISTHNKLKMAVDTYNKKNKSTGSIDKFDMRFGITQNGIGLTMRL